MGLSELIPPDDELVKTSNDLVLLGGESAALAAAIERYRQEGVVYLPDGVKPLLLEEHLTGLRAGQGIAGVTGDLVGSVIGFVIGGPVGALVGAKVGVFGRLNEFRRLFFHELREIVCQDQRSRRVSKSGSHTAMAVLAGIVATKLGLAEPAALGMATLIVLTLIEATKRSFCKMTDDELIAAIREYTRTRREGKKDARRRRPRKSGKET